VQHWQEARPVPLPLLLPGTTGASTSRFERFANTPTAHRGPPKACCSKDWERDKGHLLLSLSYTNRHGKYTSKEVGKTLAPELLAENKLGVSAV
jgi:hypothetical protein